MLSVHRFYDAFIFFPLVSTADPWDLVFEQFCVAASLVNKLHLLHTESCLNG